MYETLYYLAIAVVLLSHLWIIYQGGMPASQSVMHAYLNVIAGLVIVFYFWSNRA